MNAVLGIHCRGRTDIACVQRNISGPARDYVIRVRFFVNYYTTLSIVRLYSVGRQNDE
jgi:hypothetical protein